MLPVEREREVEVVSDGGMYDKEERTEAIDNHCYELSFFSENLDCVLPLTFTYCKLCMLKCIKRMHISVP